MEEAGRYLAELGDSPVRTRWRPGSTVPCPTGGSGALQALGELIDLGMPAAVRSSGMFHFVTGGVTSAALGGLARIRLDHNAFSWMGRRSDRAWRR